MKSRFIVLTWYLFGIFFLVAALGSLGSEPIIGFGLIACSLLCFPFARTLAFHLTGLTITGKPLLGLLALFLFAPPIVSAVVEQRSTLQDRERLAQQLERQNEDDFRKGKDALLAKANRLINEGASNEALELLRPFASVSDNDLEATRNRAQGRIDAAERKQQKAVLLTKLAATDKDRTNALLEIYRALVEIEPDNLEYKALRDQFAVIAAKQEADRQALFFKKAQGLVWRYNETSDDMTGQPISFASVRSINEFEFDFPYQGKQRATLTIRRHPRWGTNVILQIERGQFSCSIAEYCSVAVKFDSRRVQSLQVAAPDSHETTTRFIKDEVAFLEAVIQSHELLIEADFFSEGRRTFRFDISGFNQKSSN